MYGVSVDLGRLYDDPDPAYVVFLRALLRKVEDYTEEARRANG